MRYPATWSPHRQDVAQPRSHESVPLPPAHAQCAHRVAEAAQHHYPIRHRLLAACACACACVCAQYRRAHPHLRSRCCTAGTLRLTVDTRRVAASQCFAQHLQRLLRDQPGCASLLACQCGLLPCQCLLLLRQCLQRIGRCRLLRWRGGSGRRCACRRLPQARLSVRRQLRGEYSLPFLKAC